MKLRFTGKYTGAETITLLGVTFVGREPSLVSGEAANRLARHPEFEVVEELPVVVAPKRRGRPRKAD